MSDLQLVESDDAMLDVLAFLDAWEAPSKRGVSGDVPLSGDAGGLWTKHCEQRKRAHRLAVKSRYRRRVKEEYSRLRGDVLVLESALAQLKGCSSAAVPGRAVDCKALAERSPTRPADQAAHQSYMTTREAAIHEYKHRKQSESLNRELRALLSKVRKASNVTTAVWDTLLAAKMLREPHPLQPTQQLMQPQQSVGRCDSKKTLTMRLDQLALDTDWHFERAGLTDAHSFTYRMERTVDPLFDAAFEIVMSSSLPCSKEKAASLMLKFLNNDDSHGFTQVDNLETFQNTVKSVRFGHQQHRMDGLCSKRIIVESDRIRIVWSTISFLPNAATSIREDSILALQCTTASGSAPACLLQIWYRVSAEPLLAPLNTRLQINPQSELLKESVLRSHCRTTGEFFQSVEEMLANEVFA